MLSVRVRDTISENIRAVYGRLTLFSLDLVFFFFLYKILENPRRKKHSDGCILLRN